LAQLLDYWRDPSRAPFPSTKDLADRIGCKPKTIQTNIRELEKAGLVTREKRRTAAGDWNSNLYHLKGLVERVQKLEPEFAEAKAKKREA
jgi:DNA-binding transcriptional regulator YhcF (GntR family)